MFQNLDIFKMSHAMAVHAGQKQAVAAQNVANANTPGFKAHVLPSFAESFRSDLQSDQRATRSGHINGTSAGMMLQSVVDTDAVSSPNGNTVSLEEQMLQSLDAKRQHDRALAIYKSTLSVLRTSIGR